MLLFAFLLSGARSADFAHPHPHRETRAPFNADSRIIPRLSSSDIETLEKGEVVLKQSQAKNSGVGAAVEDVDAPPSVVWSQLLSFDTYPSKVPRVKVCENYHVSKRELKTRFVVRVCPGYNVEYFVKHVHSGNALVWTLDYDHSSDIDDVHGIWRVTPHPHKRGWSRVEYSADLRVRVAVPGFILDTLTNKALKEACAWVKTESEKQAETERRNRVVAFGNGASGVGGGAIIAFLDAGLRDVETTVLDFVHTIQGSAKRLVSNRSEGEDLRASTQSHTQDQPTTTIRRRRRYVAAMLHPKNNKRLSMISPSSKRGSGGGKEEDSRQSSSWMQVRRNLFFSR